MPLSEADQALLDRLKQEGVVSKIHDHLLDQGQGVIMVSCGDGDHYHDIFAHHAETSRGPKESPRIHTISLNGGALLLPAETQLNATLREDLVMIAQIKMARSLKQIDVIALYAHWPCGAAGHAHMNFVQVLEGLVKAKQRLKSDLGQREGVEARIACFIHLARPDNRRTYFVSATRWQEIRGFERYSQLPAPPAEASEASA